MFGIPGKQAVTITPKASAQISKLMASAGHAGLRIGISGTNHRRRSTRPRGGGEAQGKREGQRDVELPSVQQQAQHYS